MFISPAPPLEASRVRPLSVAAGIASPRVAIAHDYLTQQGGAERVVLHLADTFPEAPIFTSLYDKNRTFPQFRGRDIRCSPLQRISVLRRDPRLALPLLPSAWNHDLSQYDAVVASTSGWAHAIAPNGDIRRVIYCHNPARWLYQKHDYMTSRTQRRVLGLATPALVRWDKRAASRAAVYLANSRVVQARIKSTYGLDAEFVPPPTGLSAKGIFSQPKDAPEPGFVLTVARNRGYKNTTKMIQLFAARPSHHLAIVGLSRDELRGAPANIHPLGRVTDDELRWLYSNATALVSLSQEDFGLTPIEANLFGTPAVTIDDAGFKDSVNHGVSGLRIGVINDDSLFHAIHESQHLDKDKIRLHSDLFSPDSFKKRIMEAVQSVV